MKTYDDLYPALVGFENLYQAYRKAARGKRRTPAAASFEYNEHMSVMVNEVGKLLGGWIKKV
jgi:hypothetical protein